MNEPLKNIPNAVGVLVLGIVSIPTCFCYGIIGLVCAIISLVLHSNAMKAVDASPESYDMSNMGMMKAGKVCAIIGLCLSMLLLLFIIVVLIMGGSANYQELLEQYQ